jgi:hypothetical protein
MPYPPGNVHQCLKDTSSRKSALKRTKGQPKGSVVTDKTQRPWVAEKDLASDEATGQNNSNLTSLTALAENGEWELILANSSHYCFYHLPSCFSSFSKTPFFAGFIS